jgi:hypothetical protein
MDTSSTSITATTNSITNTNTANDPNVKKMMDIICNSNIKYLPDFDETCMTFYVNSFYKGSGDTNKSYMLQLSIISPDDIEVNDDIRLLIQNPPIILEKYQSADKLYDNLNNSNFVLGSNVIALLNLKQDARIPFLNFLVKKSNELLSQDKQNSLGLIIPTIITYVNKFPQISVVATLLSVPFVTKDKNIGMLHYTEITKQGQQGQQEDTTKNDYNFLIYGIASLVLSTFILSNDTQVYIGDVYNFLEYFSDYFDVNNKSELVPFKITTAGGFITPALEKKGEGENEMANTPTSDSVIFNKDVLIAETNNKISEICKKTRTNGYESLEFTDVSFLLQYLFELNILNNNNNCIHWLERTLLPNVLNPQAHDLLVNIEEWHNQNGLDNSNIITLFSFLFISKTIHDIGCKSLFIRVTEKIKEIMKGKQWTDPNMNTKVKGINISEDLITKYCNQNKNNNGAFIASKFTPFTRNTGPITGPVNSSLVINPQTFGNPSEQRKRARTDDVNGGRKTRRTTVSTPKKQTRTKK